MVPVQVTSLWIAGSLLTHGDPLVAEVVVLANGDARAAGGRERLRDRVVSLPHPFPPNERQVDARPWPSALPM